MNTIHQKLEGAFLPITTPFTADMRVDYEALTDNMHFYAESGIHGFLALGSNGENRCLSDIEKRHVLEVIMAEKAPHQVVMTGCIYDSTALTIGFMEFAKRLGSDFATLLTPSYFRKQMTQEVLYDYFRECADSVDLPVLLYNAPRFTGVTIAPETVGRLAQHPNIVGMKDSAESGIENFCKYDSSKFTVMAGSADFFYTSMAIGVRGGVVSLGNVDPRIALTLYENGKRGQDEEGLAYHERMKTANKKISGMYGVPGVKCAMDFMGLAGEHPRKPLKRLEGQDKENVRHALIEAGILQ
jgi:4-hydroxy-2-oxoglutarate aldolase